MQHDLEHHYAVKTSRARIEQDLGVPDSIGHHKNLTDFGTWHTWTVPDNADSFGMYTIYKDREELSTYQVFFYDKRNLLIKCVIYAAL